MKQRLFTVVAVLLVFVIAFQMPVRAFAESRTNYISDIKIGYGDEGKAALKNAGYTVFENLNANEGGKGGSVWIGYKQTDNADEAITDIALMNMRGGYSFEAYQQELADMQVKIQNMISEFQDAIAEFRTNYEAGSVLAVKAAQIMDLFIEDDSGKTIGQMILDPNTSNETLEKVFLQGNTDILNIIENALALGCSELGTDTFLDRLANEEYTDELDPSLNVARSRIVSVFPSFHNVMEGATTAMEAANNAESMDAYYETLTEDEKTSFLYAYGLYQITNEVDFGDTGMTLYDFAMLDMDEENEDGWILNDELVDILARAMTAGQRSVVFSVGLSTLITNASIDEEQVNESISSFFGEIDKLGDDKVSVYYNVDRTLFSDTESVALTSNALREKAAKEANDFGKLGILSEKAKLYMKIASGVIGGLGVISLAAGIAMKLTYAFTYYIPVPGNLIFHLVETCCFGAYSATLNLVAVVGGVVAIIAAIAMIIMVIQGYVYKMKTTQIEYTAIPRVLVDLDYDERGDKTYHNYYAAKLISAAEGETDSLKLYGDLNGLNKIDEWDVLYFTKDKRIGQPITVNVLVSESNILSASQTGLYTPIHRFGSDVPANLNQYNTTEGVKQIYVFFRTVIDNGNDSENGGNDSQIGTSFDIGSVSGYLISFIVGAGLAAAITFALTKKRKEQTSKK